MPPAPPVSPPRRSPQPPSAAAPPPKTAVDPGAGLARIHALLIDLQAPTNAHWSSFRMTQRLLEKQSRMPVAMFHAVNPFLREIVERLVPELRRIVPRQGITEEAVARLEAVCHELCEGNPEPAQFAEEVPRKLERILRFLDALRSLAQPPTPRS